MTAGPQLGSGGPVRGREGEDRPPVGKHWEPVARLGRAKAQGSADGVVPREFPVVMGGRRESLAPVLKCSQLWNSG